MTHCELMQGNNVFSAWGCAAPLLQRAAGGFEIGYEGESQTVWICGWLL